MWLGCVHTAIILPLQIKNLLTSKHHVQPRVPSAWRIAHANVNYFCVSQLSSMQNREMDVRLVVVFFVLWVAFLGLRRRHIALRERRERNFRGLMRRRELALNVVLAPHAHQSSCFFLTPTSTSCHLDLKLKTDALTHVLTRRQARTRNSRTIAAVLLYKTFLLFIFL